MKKIISTALAFFILFGLSACESREASQYTRVALVNSSEKITSAPVTTGTLYTMPGSKQVSIVRHEFIYREDSLTPELIAEKLTERTGLMFSIRSRIEPDNSVTVYWQSDSSLFARFGNIRQKEEFLCYDMKSLTLFMMNSLCRSIRANMDNVNVYYRIGNDEALRLPGLPYITFDPGIAYNHMDCPDVKVT